MAKLRYYDAVSIKVEELLKKGTELGGVDYLSVEELDRLELLSIQLERYEDGMPVVPLEELLNY